VPPASLEARWPRWPAISAPLDVCHDLSAQAKRPWCGASAVPPSCLGIRGNPQRGSHGSQIMRLRCRGIYDMSHLEQLQAALAYGVPRFYEVERNRDPGSLRLRPRREAPGGGHDPPPLHSHPSTPAVFWSRSTAAVEPIGADNGHEVAGSSRSSLPLSQGSCMCGVFGGRFRASKQASMWPTRIF
jgi:hypothetical protein